ncbi:MAG: hypothetical protein JWN72_1494 [Thermoleophilia bacterium]|nr:hypothetical protein [Thermoleophilia bacterium]
MNLSSVPTPDLRTRLQTQIDDATTRADAVDQIGERVMSGDAGAVKSLAGRLRALSDSLSQSSDLAATAGARAGASFLSSLGSQAREVAIFAQLPKEAKHMPLEQQAQLAGGLLSLTHAVTELKNISIDDLIKGRTSSGPPEDPSPAPDADYPQPPEGGGEPAPAPDGDYPAPPPEGGEPPTDFPAPSDGGYEPAPGGGGESPQAPPAA